nr:hypothetical protein [Streptomyces chartreusis]
MTTPTLKCPRCQADNDRSYTACANCGLLRGADPTKSPDPAPPTVPAVPTQPPAGARRAAPPRRPTPPGRT